MQDRDSIGAMHRDIMRRCYDEKYKLYKDYGAKGRKVCKEWHDRENFRRWSECNGYKKGLRLLRRDTKGDFCPDNCYWAVSPTKSYEYGKIKAHKAEVKKRKEEFRAIAGVDCPSNHPIESIYQGMRTRCNNPNSVHYKYYGGREITICDEWSGEKGLLNFIKWSLEEGGYEPGLTIDRINNDKGYSPDNCRWVTTIVQERNKKRVHQFIINGELHSATSFCEYRGLNYNKFMYLYHKGLTMNQILDILEK